MVYYSVEQVKNLLKEIKQMVPINTYSGNALSRFLDDKIEHIDRHI